MMWQSSMLISLLVLSPEQIYVPTCLNHGSLDLGPITLLEPPVVLIGRHGILVKILFSCVPVVLCSLVPHYCVTVVLYK